MGIAYNCTLYIQPKIQVSNVPVLDTHSTKSENFFKSLNLSKILIP